MVEVVADGAGSVLLVDKSSLEWLTGSVGGKARAEGDRAGSGCVLSQQCRHCASLLLLFFFSEGCGLHGLCQII